MINSHSVQKTLILEPLADSRHHVVMFKTELVLNEPRMWNPPKPRPKLVGIKQAMVFKGLCAAHDNMVFKPIEGQPFDTSNVEHLFLAAYRSLLMELYNKRVSRAQVQEAADAAGMDKGAHPLAKGFLQRIAQSYVLGEQWLTERKQSFDQAYLAKSFDTNLVHWGIVLPVQTNFAVSSLFTPAFDFSGKRVQFFCTQKEPHWISLSVLPRDGRTPVTMTTAKSSCAELASMCTMLRTASGEKFELLLSEMVLANIENIAIAPEFWNALPKTRQDAITDYFAATVSGRPSTFPGSMANLFRAEETET